MEKKKSVKKPKPKPQKTERSLEKTRKTFRLTIAYIGSAYSGWQKQAKSDGLDTVQEMLEKAARKVIRPGEIKMSFHGSGRTDSGVHARGQVAHLRAEVDLPATVLLKALNAHLPEDIRVLDLTECPPDFHAQLDVTAKTYRYFILNSEPGQSPVHWPFLRPYVWFVTFPLNFPAMKEALSLMEGKHDFKSFQNTGTPIEDTVREILSAELITHEKNLRDAPPWMIGPDFPGTLFEVRVRGTGFLKQMVRTMVGTIVEVGRGRLAPRDIETILREKNRRASGMTAPAHGLFLDHVEYD